MLPLQYGEVELLSGYHYNDQLAKLSSGANLKARIKRLAQEHSDFSHTLPLSLSSSVWLRASAERMDALQFVISGPDDTPYSNGLFLFDAFFPETYPHSAPKVNLQTTGKGSVRFNPNLYNCGRWSSPHPLTLTPHPTLPFR
jgi:baculoviral IAP repeat-containing protein 6